MTKTHILFIVPSFSSKTFDILIYRLQEYMTEDSNKISRKLEQNLVSADNLRRSRHLQHY